MRVRRNPLAGRSLSAPMTFGAAFLIAVLLTGARPVPVGALPGTADLGLAIDLLGAAPSSMRGRTGEIPSAVVRDHRAVPGSLDVEADLAVVAGSNAGSRRGARRKLTAPHARRTRFHDLARSPPSTPAC